MVRILLTLGVVGIVVTSYVGAGDLAALASEPTAESTRGADGIDAEIRNDSTDSTWSTRKQLLGDLGGFRTRLGRHGITFEIESLDEGFANPGREFDTGEDSHYAGLTDVIFSFDTTGAGWWKGGLFVVDLQNARGGNISDVVGDIQGISNIVAPPGTRFAEYYIDQRFANGRFRLKVGKQDANADFVVAEGGGEFINSSFGIIPTVPLPTFPQPAIGIMGGFSPNNVIHLKAGYWDGAPKLGSGISTAIIDGSQGTIGAVGIEITPFGDTILDGTYRIGVWRHSEVEISSPTTKAGEDTLTGPASGIYFTADQGLWENGDRRLSFFAQGGWGEADRSAVCRYFGGGLTFAAPFTSRPEEMVGIGVAYAEIGQLERSSTAHDSETVVELFYRLPITGWMSLNPDIQWIRQPGGSSGAVFVAGLRVATVF